MAHTELCCRFLSTATELICPTTTPGDREVPKGHPPAGLKGRFAHYFRPCRDVPAKPMNLVRFSQKPPGPPNLAQMPSWNLAYWQWILANCLA